jgi:hypothetical protein
MLNTSYILTCLECINVRPKDNKPYLCKFPKTLENLKKYLFDDKLLYINGKHIEIAYINYYFDTPQTVEKIQIDKFVNMVTDTKKIIDVNKLFYIN